MPQDVYITILKENRGTGRKHWTKGRADPSGTKAKPAGHALIKGISCDPPPWPPAKHVFFLDRSCSLHPHLGRHPTVLTSPASSCLPTPRLYVHSCSLSGTPAISEPSCKDLPAISGQASVALKLQRKTPLRRHSCILHASKATAVWTTQPMLATSLGHPLATQSHICSDFRGCLLEIL